MCSGLSALDRFSRSRRGWHVIAGLSGLFASKEFPTISCQKNWEVSFSDLNDFAAFKLAIQQRGMPDRLGMRPLIGKERRDKGIHPMR